MQSLAAPPAPPSEPEYIFVLPPTGSAKLLADGMGGGCTIETTTALAGLQTATALPPDEVLIICDSTIHEFATPAKTDTAPTQPPAERTAQPDFYDKFFAVRRLVETATKEELVRSLAKALAVVMRNTAKLEASESHVSAVEFGLLRQGFATIAESLREIADDSLVRIPTGTCPISRVTKWLRTRFPRTTVNPKQLAALVADLDAHALRMWREGHHVFFLLIIAATIELRRFIRAAGSKDSSAATRHLDRACTLMIGSGAAMTIAGDIHRESYESAVVPAMKAANPKFSGSDSEDHAGLVETYKAIGPLVLGMPPAIKDAHNRFLSAVYTAICAHTFVCSHQGGDGRASTGSGSGTKLTGVETLKRIGARWMRLLGMKRPNECPMKKNQKKDNKDEN